MADEACGETQKHAEALNLNKSQNMPELIAVNSDAITAVGYDGHTLAVLFHTSNTIYEHHGVPYSVYDGLMRASSKGGFYNRHIRGKYK